MTRRRNLLLAAIALVVLCSVRTWLEADMARHMLIEFPLLIGAGWAIGGTFSANARRAIDRWNLYGLAGLTFVLATLGFWMIPAALDAALSGVASASAKYATLFAAGTALRWSWPRAPRMVLAFFIGNVVWMMATVGLLYQEAPQQLCLYYLADSQVNAGRGLVLLAAGLLLAAGYTALRVPRPLRYNPGLLRHPGQR